MKLTTVLCLATALVLPLALAGCNEEGVGGLVTGAKEMRPIPAPTLLLMEQKGMRKEDPILIRVFKEENTLEIWKRDKTNQYALLKSYNMCAWGGTIGPKIVEGDKQSPEGFYQITPGRMNPNSQFFLAFDLGYPNAFDRAFNRTGSAVMVHGNCTGSAGCFVLTDKQVEEVYAIAREALAGGQSSFQVEAFPFRMTAANLARHRRNPNMAFWRNIKEGYDHFEVAHLEPKVDVCDKKYVFDAYPASSDATTFNAAGACPSYKVPQQLAEAVSAKQKADEAEYKTQVAALDAQERAQADSELAMRLEAAKPKKPPVNLLASIIPAAATPAAGPVSTAPISVASATPINVPIPKPSPLDVGRPDVASGYQASEKPKDSDVIGNFLNIVKLPDFGKKDDAASAPQPQVQVQQASATTQPTSPTAQDVARIKGSAPAVKQNVTTANATPPVAPAVAAAPVETPWWKKLNPFGG
jgi:murein L,D-transpeptidase YafK